MSYILDALKKSEKERQQGTVPDLMTAQDVIVREPKNRHIWPYLLVGALILNAGLFAWWLAWHSKKPVVIAQPVPAQHYASKPPESMNNPSDTRNPVAALSPESAPSDTVTRPADGKTAYRQKTPASKADAPPPNFGRQNSTSQPKADVQKNVDGKPVPEANAKGPREIPAPAPQLPAVNTAAEPQPVAHPAPLKNKLYNLMELPPSIQQGLPDFAISTHLYAVDTTSRMVRINGQSLREGQYLSAGLKVEEITSEGVIFSYQNYRFRIELK